MFNIGTALASSTAAKVAGGALAAVLTVGGTAAVTGNLPDDLQCFTADAAAHVGLTLPRPQIAVEVTESANAVVGDIINVGEAGQILVAIDGPDLGTTGADANAALDLCAELDNDAADGNTDDATAGEANAYGNDQLANGDDTNQSGDNSHESTLMGDLRRMVGDLQITDIVANDGYTAEVVSETSDSVLVEFRSDTETTSVLISKVDGSIVSSVTIEANAHAADNGASAGAWLNVWTSAYTDIQDIDIRAWLEAHAELADLEVSAWLDAWTNAYTDVADVNGSARLTGYVNIDG